MFLRYDSTAALREDYIKSCGMPTSRTPSRDGWGHYSRHDWYGGESAAQSCQLALSGDTKLVPDAEALLTQLDTHIETPRRVWNHSPVGPQCSIPEYIAGIPTCMRTLSYEMDEAAPITIFVTTTSSAGISAETLAKRGTVILALVMALSRVRPVSLHQLTIVDGQDKDGETVITSQINTNPLDLATACYVLTSAGFARRLTYDLAKAKNGFTGGWPRRYRYGNSAPYFAYLKTKLAPADPSKCLIIGSAELGDELLTQPLAWISKQISHFTHMQEEEATL